MLDRPVLTAHETAELLGVSYQWVLDHVAELGGARLGSGEGKGQMIRFHRETVLERVLDISPKERPR